jgi:hypothetical protein
MPGNLVRRAGSERRLIPDSEARRSRHDRGNRARGAPH